MMTVMREKVINELERVVQCREMARCAWHKSPEVNDEVQKVRIQSLAQFNETILALKEALLHNSAGLMQKALELSGRTP